MFQPVCLLSWGPYMSRTMSILHMFILDSFMLRVAASSKPKLDGLGITTLKKRAEPQSISQKETHHVTRLLQVSLKL